MNELRGATDIGDYLISARSFAEYQGMFALTPADLRGRILDCPGGGASFAASVGPGGSRFVAVDPVYASPVHTLVTRLDDELARGSAWAAANAERYVWDFYGSAEAHGRLRADSARIFAEDLLSAPGRYVAAVLPHLPFPDGAFDVVLSSHLLFTYSDRLDAGFHLTAVREMARVGREVRVYPLVDQAGRPLPQLLGSLIDGLRSCRLDASVEPVNYEFQRGARSMLRIRRPDATEPTRRMSPE